MVSEIRRFTADDAAAVSNLFRLVYGDNYVYPDVYQPLQICHHNQAGRWCSVVAMQDGQVIGHANLWRDPSCKALAELGMVVVHPQARRQGIATALGRLLCHRAADMQLKMLAIKEVVSHTHSQQLADTLGFHTTGLLLDYVPSPFNRLQLESVVLGCLPLTPHPFPDLAWPVGWQVWLTPLVQPFGLQPQANSCHVKETIHMTIEGQRIDVVLSTVTARQLKEVAALPATHRLYIKLSLNNKTPQDISQLQQMGFSFTGFVPTCDSWQALMIRGHQQSSLSLCNSIARQLNQGIN
jgi:RimJ/RimL family protein N-acetyltransferase